MKFIDRFEKLPRDVQEKILEHLHAILKWRGHGDEMRLCQHDDHLEEVVNCLEENGIEILEYK